MSPCPRRASPNRCWSLAPPPPAPPAPTPTCCWRRWRGPTPSRRPRVRAGGAWLCGLRGIAGCLCSRGQALVPARLPALVLWLPAPSPAHPPCLRPATCPYHTGWVVLYVPRGKYTLTAALKITRSRTVLRGAGRGATILNIPKSERPGCPLLWQQRGAAQRLCKEWICWWVDTGTAAQGRALMAEACWVPARLPPPAAGAAALLAAPAPQACTTCMARTPSRMRHVDT